MKDKKFIRNYFDEFTTSIKIDEELVSKLVKIKELIIRTKLRKKKIVNIWQWW